MMETIVRWLKTKQKRHVLPLISASFTVEASLLMAVILPVLIGILLAGFYVHDQAFLQGAVCEVSGMGSSMALYADRDARMWQTLNKRTGKSMLWARGLNQSCSASKTMSQALISATFRFPGMVAAFFGRDRQALEEGATRKVYHPADLIRTFQGARDLLGD